MQIITDHRQKETKKHGTADFPFLVSHEQISAYETGSFLWHWHPELELTLITSGEMIYRVNGAAFHLKAGDVLLVNSGCMHSASMYEQQDCRYTPVTFDARLLYGSESRILYTRFVLPVLQNTLLPAVLIDGSKPWHKEAAALTRALIETGESDSEVRELDIQILLLSFWKLLYRNLERTAPEDSGKETRDYLRIRQILTFVEENFSGKLTLEDISAELCLCKGECCRIFRRYMNQSLFEFLQQYRIEQSLPLLADRQLSITEISERTGFSDPNYFAKVFRKQKGCSPSDYRRQIDL